jgi:hypothetical protein
MVLDGSNYQSLDDLELTTLIYPVIIIVGNIGSTKVHAAGKAAGAGSCEGVIPFQVRVGETISWCAIGCIRNELETACFRFYQQESIIGRIIAVSRNMPGLFNHVH